MFALAMVGSILLQLQHAAALPTARRPRSVDPPNPALVDQSVTTVAGTVSSSDKTFEALAGVFDGDGDGLLTIEELFDLKECAPLHAATT
eukprot:SAG31_NODE_3770_length_3900_cov_4.289924_4_plen_90_part_00